MRILHTSDIHLDSPLTTRLSSDKVRQRRGELLSGFGRLIEEAVRLKADAMIIAGDLFDSGHVSRRAMTTALDMITQAANIHFYYLPGNHEGDAIANSGREIPENLHIFGSEWSYFELSGLTFAGRCEINEKIFDELSLPNEGRSIVVLHGELRERCSAPETVGLNDAANRGIDYLALGHYHSYSATPISGGGVAVYCGTPEGRGFDEAGEKGYVLIEADQRGISHSFHPFAKRQLHIVKIFITGASSSAEICQRAKAALQGIKSTDIVRLELCGRYCPELWKDTESIYSELSGKYYYFEIKDSSKMAINPEDYRYDKSLKGEFIRTVSADAELSEDMKEKIIRCGINALMGEELFGD